MRLWLVCEPAVNTFAVRNPAGHRRPFAAHVAWTPASAGVTDQRPPPADCGAADGYSLIRLEGPDLKKIPAEGTFWPARVLNRVKDPQAATAAGLGVGTLPEKSDKVGYDGTRQTIR
jgi:hypothetical protein